MPARRKREWVSCSKRGHTVAPRQQRTFNPWSNIAHIKRLCKSSVQRKRFLRFGSAAAAAGRGVVSSSGCALRGLLPRRRLREPSMRSGSIFLRPASIMFFVLYSPRNHCSARRATFTAPAHPEQRRRVEPQTLRRVRGWALSRRAALNNGSAARCAAQQQRDQRRGTFARK